MTNFKWTADVECLSVLLMINFSRTAYEHETQTAKPLESEEIFIYLMLVFLVISAFKLLLHLPCIQTWILLIGPFPIKNKDFFQIPDIKFTI